MHLALAELEVEKRRGWVQFEMAVFGEDQEGWLVTAIRDHHALEPVVAIALVDVDDQLAEASKFACLQKRSARRDRVEQADQFSACLVLDSE